MSEDLVVDFAHLGLRDVGRVGGKNASLGELWNALSPKGIGVVDGFATTSEFYRRFTATRNLRAKLAEILSGFDPRDVRELAKRGDRARSAVLETPIPDPLRAAILEAYTRLSTRIGREAELAVRSSATAEDLPGASFAGQQET